MSRGTPVLSVEHLQSYRCRHEWFLTTNSDDATSVLKTLTYSIIEEKIALISAVYYDTAVQWDRTHSLNAEEKVLAPIRTDVKV